MVIRGFLKTTLLDYPGHVAATIFLGGCNMRCVFCHNMDIVENTSGEYSCDEILSHLNKRKNVLDGVCITGGEPTLYADLPDFIRRIKSLGLLVKLDTNGTNPEMLKYLIDENLIDYVAMDIKASYDKYSEICGTNCNLDKIKESVNLLLSLNSNPVPEQYSDNTLSSKPESTSEQSSNNALNTPSVVGYEFRTTITNEYHDIEEIKKIGQMINGADKYFLQDFKDSDFVPNHTLTPPDKATFEQYTTILRNYVKTVQIRGVE